MKRIDLYFEIKILKELKRISEKTGAPVSEIIRRAVKFYLKEAKHKK